MRSIQDIKSLSDDKLADQLLTGIDSYTDHGIIGTKAGVIRDAARRLRERPEPVATEPPPDPPKVLRLRVFNCSLFAGLFLFTLLCALSVGDLFETALATWGLGLWLVFFACSYWAAIYAPDPYFGLAEVIDSREGADNDRA